MTSSDTHSHNSHACLRFEANLSAWLENDMDPVQVQWMETHRSECTACNSLYNDLTDIAFQAASLPRLIPTHDLWLGIESRIDSHVLPFNQFPQKPHTHEVAQSPAQMARRNPSHVRWAAIAAVALVSIGSALTWGITHFGIASLNRPAISDARSTRIDSVTIAQTDDPVSPTFSTAEANATQVADNTLIPDASTTYENAITELHSIVNDRFSELDSSTVNVLLENLAIIDQAIADCKSALARDPNSGAANDELERVTRTKFVLMRRIVQL